MIPKKETKGEIHGQPVTNAVEQPPARVPRVWELQPMLDYEPKQEAVVRELVRHELASIPGVGYVLTRNGWRMIEVQPVTTTHEPPRSRSVHVTGMGSGRQESKQAKRFNRWSKR